MENSDEEKLNMRITPLTVIEFNRLLDWLKDHGKYMATIDNVNMKFMGITEDTINGKREMFYIERKIK